MRADSENVELDPYLVYLRRQGKDCDPVLCVVMEEGGKLLMLRLNRKRRVRLLADLAQYEDMDVTSDGV